jgi:hypothetical protein
MCSSAIERAVTWNVPACLGRMSSACLTLRTAIATTLKLLNLVRFANQVQLKART